MSTDEDFVDHSNEDLFKTNDLKDGMRKVNIDAIVLSFGKKRTVNLRACCTSDVCDVTIGDEMGELRLSLWNEEIDKVTVGAKVAIRNGYMSSYNGKSQLNVGRFGSLEVIE